MLNKSTESLNRLLGGSQRRTPQIGFSSVNRISATRLQENAPYVKPVSGKLLRNTRQRQMVSASVGKTPQ